VSGNEQGIELLLSEPEVVAWLEPGCPEDDADDRAGAEPAVRSRTVPLGHGGELLVRPLRHGDARTVVSLFSRLGEESRRKRFRAAKPQLGEKELRWLTAVDARHRVLVAYVDGDPEPVAIARLVGAGSSAEIAFAVADEHQRRGIGTALTAELVADARRAGIAEITALVGGDNPAALALLRRALGALEIRIDGPELSIRAAVSSRDQQRPPPDIATGVNSPNRSLSDR
jgi:ribosomal protein S18 acetylase RimI-like enzyme